MLSYLTLLVSIKSARTKKTRKTVERECLTLQDLIEANVGENVQLLTVDPLTSTKEWLSGTLTSVKRAELASEIEMATPETLAPNDIFAFSHPPRSRKSFPQDCDI